MNMYVHGIIHNDLTGFFFSTDGKKNAFEEMQSET